MDPFALQYEARKHTGLLVSMACSALVIITLVMAFIITAACWCLYLYFGTKHGRATDPYYYRLAYTSFSYLDFLVHNPHYAYCALAAASVFVFTGFFWKLFSMGSGAELMRKVGATQVRRSQIRKGKDEDLWLLRLFNVCEEISIASGVDMPSVWVLPKDMEINAFVAGASTASPALCVTTGALRYLTRDELQGVIAHEFSHILNGDMELNFRLLALIAGITVVSRTGKLMATWFIPKYWGEKSDSEKRRGSGGSFRSGGRGGKGGGGIIVILLVYFGTAAALWISGAVGVFFARLIQCAVSRKREYLADASAAQFTRHPEALANALRLTYLVQMKRGRTAFGAWRDDVAHMLFTEGSRDFFATHPDVKSRIERLSPGSGLKTDDELRKRIQRISEDGERRAAEVNAEFRARATGFVPQAKTVDTDMSTATLRKIIPLEVRQQLADPDKAGMTLTELLRGKVPMVWSGELNGDLRRKLALHCVITICDAPMAGVRTKWAETVRRISEEDGEISSFEFMIGVAITRRLEPKVNPHILSPLSALPSVARVISTIASCGSDPARGYRAAEQRLSLFGRNGLPAMPEPFADSVDFAAELGKLAQLPPLAKRELMFGIRETVAQDGVVTEEESDFLMAVADAIGACGWVQVA